MNPIESGARALRERAKANRSIVHGDDETGWKYYVVDVRAVIAAIREPSEAMAKAGSEVTRHVSEQESPAAFENDAIDTWRFMVDELLAEED